MTKKFKKKGSREILFFTNKRYTRQVTKRSGRETEQICRLYNSCLSQENSKWTPLEKRCENSCGSFLLFLFSFYTHKAIVIPEQVIALSLSAAVRKYLVRDVGVQRFVNFGLREARRMFVCKNKKRKVLASFYFTTDIKSQYQQL